VFSQRSLNVKHDLRKNKIVVASTTGFLGISAKFEALTKFKMIKSILDDIIPKEVNLSPLGFKSKNKF
jgi:hypothetical protein